MITLVEYAKSFLGVHYRWGGETPQGGYDCSGLVQEILSSVGMDKPGDQTAHGLYNHFVKISTPLVAPAPGALVFYSDGPDRTMTHVAFAIDSFRVIEAGGGGSKTVNIAMSIEHKAFVRMRPYNHRKDVQYILMPPYDVQKDPLI